MSRFSYGSFEDLLQSYFVKKITKKKLAAILLTAPLVADIKSNDDRDSIRESETIDDSTLSKYRSGKRRLPSDVADRFATDGAVDKVKDCFAVDIVPQILESSEQELLNKMLTLIKNDTELSTERKVYFDKLARANILADFLAEVFLLVITMPVTQQKKGNDAPERQKNPVKDAVTSTTRTVIPVRPGWGDNGRNRPSYTLAQINGGILGDTIVFNSISDSVIGDEKFFVGVRRDDGDHRGADNVWGINYITARHEAVYLIRLYIHNNNPNGIRAIAKDVRAAIDIPESSAKDLLVSGFIESSNAVPSKYWASVVFHSEVGAFHLEYIWGSAHLENNGLGQHRSIKVSNDIVTRASTGGILVDFDTLDGSIPGGYTYDSFVGIRVKAVFDTEFLVSQEVRLADATEWQDSIEAKTGDTIELQIEYRNLRQVQQNDVTVRAVLPSGLEYIPGTTKLFCSNRPSGNTITEDNVANTGINIGSYAPNTNAFLRFSVKVSANSGAKTILKSWARVTADKVLLQDCVAITVIE